jgi:hypothetical protein
MTSSIGSLEVYEGLKSPDETTFNVSWFDARGLSRIGYIMYCVCFFFTFPFIAMENTMSSNFQKIGVFVYLVVFCVAFYYISYKFV